MFSLGHYANAQNDDSGNLAFPTSFAVNTSLLDGKIKILDSQYPLNISGSFAINVALTYLPKFTEVLTSIAVVDGSSVLYSANGPTFKKPDDFQNSTSPQTTYKNFNIEIPYGTVSNIITTYPNAKLIIRYKIYYDKSSNFLPTVSSSGWIPNLFDGREFYTHNKKFGFIDARPRATITGPDEIATEGTYQVSGATSFIILPYNLVGGSAINATLNHLGSGRYVVTGKPGFIGDIYLEATHSNNLKTAKKVKITGPPLSIEGDNTICTESIYTLTNASSVTLENATGIATLTDLGNAQYKVARVGNASGAVTIKATNANGDVVNKSITVGVLKPLAINGHSNPLNWSNNYIYTVDTPNPNDVLEIEKSGASQVTFTRLSNNSFRITTPTKPNNPGPVSKVYLVNINARVVSDCGNSEYISKEINVGTSVPFE